MILLSNIQIYSANNTSKEEGRLVNESNRREYRSIRFGFVKLFEDSNSDSNFSVCDSYLI